MNSLQVVLLMLLAVLPVAGNSQDNSPNLVLVTIDGMRWQEVFHGLDSDLLADQTYTTLQQELRTQFASGNAGASSRRIMPFVHEVMATKGMVIGDRLAGSCARVTNPWYFSYPGYNEILTGRADPAIDSNDAVANHNVTFLEWLNKDVQQFRGKVAVFGSWNVFPAIINQERSGIPVSVTAVQPPQTDSEKLLARLQADLPMLWSTVRLDVLTHYSALDYLKTRQPKVMYIAYGETDDFAHDGHYDQYVFAAHRTDRFLRELWDTLQTMPNYRDNTVLFVTTDHGRGGIPLVTWQHHASKAAMAGMMQDLNEFENGIEGSDAVWMAAIGPGIDAAGLITGSDCYGSNRIAATLIRLLGLDPADFAAGVGPVLPLSSEPGARANEGL